MIRAAVILAAALAALLVSCVKSEDYCYDEPHCDPYAWGDMFPPCHPLIEEHHSPINLDHRMTRDHSLGPLHLQGFNETQTGHWTLKNDGHSIVLQVGDGMSVSGGGLAGVYHTVQMHFHWGGVATNGSEHTVDGRRYPMEMHVVNMKSIHPNVTAALGDPTGLAVLGFFLDVVYADNAHFGLVSQKLSSVAYKAGPLHLADLLHGGGRGAGDPSAEQLPARPPHLQSRRLRVQRRRSPRGGVRSSPGDGRVAASASDGFAWKPLVWTLMTRLQREGFLCFTTKRHLGDDLQRTRREVKTVNKVL
ncbi:carbonic anhydrase 15 isoform 2-T2 [Spinachia spinachia]